MTNDACLVYDFDEAHIFEGNIDTATNVTNDLSDYNLVCKYIRFYPIDIVLIGSTYIELYGGKYLAIFCRSRN